MLGIKCRDFELATEAHSEPRAEGFRCIVWKGWGSSFPSSPSPTWAWMAVHKIPAGGWGDTLQSFLAATAYYIPLPLSCIFGHRLQKVKRIKLQGACLCVCVCVNTGFCCCSLAVSRQLLSTYPPPHAIPSHSFSDGTSGYKVNPQLAWKDWKAIGISFIYLLIFLFDLLFFPLPFSPAFPLLWSNT